MRERAKNRVPGQNAWGRAKSETDVGAKLNWDNLYATNSSQVTCGRASQYFQR